LHESTFYAGAIHAPAKVTFHDSYLGNLTSE